MNSDFSRRGANHHGTPSNSYYVSFICIEAVTSDRKLKASREGSESEQVPVRISGVGFRPEGLGFGVCRLELRVRSREVVMWGSGLRI